MTVIATGFLSIYALTPTLATVELRQEWGQLPQDVSPYILLAMPDCDRIGDTLWLQVDGEYHQALVFDCAGDEQTYQWMKENNIVAELGHGAPESWIGDTEVKIYDWRYESWRTI